MVFDSVNGSTVKSKDGKPLRAAVTAKSLHLQFWNEAIQVFQSMHFINKLNGKKVHHHAWTTGYKHCVHLNIYGVIN